MDGFGLTLTNKAKPAFLWINYNLLLTLLLLNNHLKGDYIDCHVCSGQGYLSLVEIVTTEIQRVPADVVFVLEGINILLCRRLALDSEIIDFDGVTIETDRQSEAY